MPLDFEKARKTMVDCQIHPAGVSHEALLQRFENVPREKFLPPALQALAYADRAIEAAPGRVLLDPATCARLFQAADPLPTHRVLDIGGLSGYTAAILAPLVRSVVAVESPEALAQARKLWEGLQLSNVTGFAGPLEQGCPQHAPYDLIFINGAIAAPPPILADQLAGGGRLIAIVKKAQAHIGQAILFEKTSLGYLSPRPLFETAGGDFLPGFEPPPAFRF